jgi:hypothetical protein
VETVEQPKSPHGTTRITSPIESSNSTLFVEMQGISVRERRSSVGLWPSLQCYRRYKSAITCSERPNTYADLYHPISYDCSNPRSGVESSSGYNHRYHVQGKHPVDTRRRAQLESCGERYLDTRAAATTCRTNSPRRSGRNAVQCQSFCDGQIWPQPSTTRRDVLRCGIQKTHEVAHHPKSLPPTWRISDPEKSSRWCHAAPLLVSFGVARNRP